MKTGILLLILLTFFQAQAAPVCATKQSELPNIKELTKKVNLFGTWTGTMDGSTVTARIYLNTDTLIRGTVNYDGSDYGPASIKVCQEESTYFLVVYGHEVEFEVLGKNKIKGYSPFDSTTLVLTRQ